MASANSSSEAEDCEHLRENTCRNAQPDGLPLNRSESGKTAADISRDHFWAHYSKHAETMKRREEEVQELLSKDPLHFARRPSESAGVRFGSFTDVDIHVQQRISEFDKDDDGSKEEGQDAPPTRNLWFEMFERDQAASKIQAWWRRLHGYTYKKEEEKLKPARSRRRGPQRCVTMSGLSSFSENAGAHDPRLLRRAASVRADPDGQRNSLAGARNHSLPRRAISFRVNKEEQSSPRAPKGPPPPLRRMASTSCAMDGSFRRRSSSVNPVSSEDGQQQKLRRRSSTNLQSEDSQLDDELAPWCNAELRLESEPRDDLLQQQELRRLSSTSALSEEGSLKLRRRSSTNFSSEAARHTKSLQQSRGGSQQGEGEGDGRGTAASARRRSVCSDASSDPRWIIQKDASSAVSGASSEAGSVDGGGLSRDTPGGGVLYHQRLHRQQQQNRSAGLGKPQTSLPIQTPAASMLKLDPGASLYSSRRGSLSQEMEVTKAPMLCLGLYVSQPDSPLSGHAGVEARQGSSKSQAVAGNFGDQSHAGLPMCDSDMGPAADVRMGSMASRNSVGNNRLRLLKSRPGFATGRKLEPRRSSPSMNLPNQSSSLLASPDQKPVVIENTLRGRCSSSMEDLASCLILSPRDRASSSSFRSRSHPPGEHSCHAAADAAGGTSLASRSSNPASLRYLPDIHLHHSTAGTAPSFNSSTNSRFRRHSSSNVIPNPFKDVQLSPAGDAPPHGGMATGSRQSRSLGALQPTRLQSIWANPMQG
ncbi:hypothetical protein DUNSADRAFT_14452 [Dunaliella salina]|uniref:Uncharacterized protein n=1 Tax=Dunaliella salina TaxID=3046 RepID=A0ABQ7H9K6_DUNSA|nr:hypothetical protein DUNSADRAFT_14452 [Dunaliella salina]|eukprot:KAF5843536.1 hypothetical protein DUNSADRAFT_14452 [Dunaliella salina]